MTQKTAVVLMNLGGPDGFSSIRPFLFNFFMDKNIVDLPQPLRFLTAALIAWRRGGGAARDAYGYLGGISPLLENTRKQAQSLESLLIEKGMAAKVFVSMRYWHPFARDVARAVKAYAPDNIILLPLYPQFSTTTTRSSFQSWEAAAKKAGLKTPTQHVCCYPVLDGFIEASVENIRAAFDTAPKNTRLLFSAHGLPEKIIAGGDPYQHQTTQTAKAIVEALAIPELDWQICYQSRVGRLKWIGPSTEDALRQAAADGKSVVIYPHAFVSEHVETLVEIEIEYRELAKKLGIPFFARAKTVGTHPAFISALAQRVTQTAQEEKCPATCTKCWLSDK